MSRHPLMLKLVMDLITKPISKQKIAHLQSKHGNYIKLTVEIERGWLVAGIKLHADGERTLLEKGGDQDNIWGGGLDFENKQIDTAAVLNLRPNFQNDGLEILDPKIRKKFIKIVKEIFILLWK